MQDDAHALVRGDEGGDADEVAGEGDGAVCARGGAQGEDDAGDEREQDDGDAEAAREDDARAVAVADGPADEVGVCLVAQRVFYAGGGGVEGRRVGRVLQGVQDGLALA